ncbi:hypothetical protein ACJRO7_006820 [Eucalyptus globulus]|uniref:Uncharacterized protein n=1 Tax=Eucalyptus globulus TaxID=34317 RepID=A0ABD3IMQ2_EUCGL
MLTTLKSSYSTFSLGLGLVKTKWDLESTRASSGRAEDGIAAGTAAFGVWSQRRWRPEVVSELADVGNGARAEQRGSGSFAKGGAAVDRQQGSSRNSAR